MKTEIDSFFLFLMVFFYLLPTNFSINVHIYDVSELKILGTP